MTGVAGAHVLVTAEGRELYSKQVVQASETHSHGRRPRSRGVHTQLFRQRRFRHAMASFMSELEERFRPGRRAAVEGRSRLPRSPSSSLVSPAIYTITARDSADKPVAAEFSLGVVDEAIYSVRPESVQDIFKFFYGRTYNRISTSSSLSYYFQGESGKKRCSLPQMRRRGNLAQLKPEALVQPQVRKAFPDTALWLANVTTDSSGRAIAKLEFPDALTTWRATARGVTQDTKVGAAVHKVIVRKNLMTRLVTPRFFTAGDEVTISVLAHNYLKNEKTARVSLEVKGLEIIDGSTRDVQNSRQVAKPRSTGVCAPPSPGPPTVARQGAHRRRIRRDGADAPRSIPYGVKLVEPRGHDTRDPPATRKWSSHFRSGVQSSRTLQISVTPSVAGTIFGALDYLTSFPYGCTEQTMSSFLPNVIVSQALKELQLKSRIDPAVLQKKVKAGLDRLYDFQHEDGGWGWWKTDESHPLHDRVRDRGPGAGATRRV